MLTLYPFNSTHLQTQPTPALDFKYFVFPAHGLFNPPTIHYRLLWTTPTNSVRGAGLRLTNEIQLPAKAISWRFTLSSGPGGQNVNKVATAVELRVDLEQTTLRPQIIERLNAIERAQINQAQVLVIKANTYRSQWRNRLVAIERLKQLLVEASTPRRRRVPSRRTSASVRKRLAAKKRKSEKKRWRRHAPAE